MRARSPIKKTSRLSLSALVALSLAACGDGSTFYVDPLVTGTDSVVDQTDTGGSGDSALFTTYTAGKISNFPQTQAAATGAASVTWLIAEIDGSQSSPEMLERIQATSEGFARYVDRQSRGAFTASDIRISPALQITTDGDMPSIEALQELTRAAADTANFQYDDSYVAYLLVSDNLQGIAHSSSTITGDSQSGSVVVSADFEMAHTVREMVHMLSIGSANAMDGGTATFPGEIVSDGDPYFFTGDIGAANDCSSEATPCEITANLSLPHKARAGWLAANEVIVSENTGLEKIFKLYNQDNHDRSETQPLTVYLTGYDPDGLFAVSYLTESQNDSPPLNQTISSTGVMVHYVAYDSPQHSYLVDLTPGSVTSNNEQPDNALYTALYDFGDAAVANGASVSVGGLFTIEVLDTGSTDSEDHWADISISPSTCIYPARNFAQDDFIPDDNSAEGYCDTGYSYDWGIKPTRAGEAALTATSIEYPGLDTIGGSLQLTVDQSANDALGLNRPLTTTYTDGDTLWVSYLLTPQQIGNGHMLIYPGNELEAGIGKQWGEPFAIGNQAASAPIYPVVGESAWLVGKYELVDGPDSISFWVNPVAGTEPTASTTYTTRDDIDIGDVDSISINLNNVGSGQYDIDRVHTGAAFTDISAVLAPARSAPLIALHYDVSPDLDDLQAIAAGADLSSTFNIDPAVVIGSYGISGQFSHGGNDPIALVDLYNSDTNMLGQGANDGETRRIKARQVADAAYGIDGYLDTGNGWEESVNAQAEKFWVSLQAGQVVLIADGGPMDFTANVLARLQSHHGASDDDLKRITVVQHSLGFNVSNTRPENLQSIIDLATYVTIDNGNVGGNGTANLEDSSVNTTTSDFAMWARNNSTQSEAWNSALDDFSAKIDYSDTVEYLYILDIPLDLVSDITTFRQILD